MTLTEELVTQCARCVLGAIDTPPLQFWNDEPNDILERSRGDGVRKVESVDVGLVHPLLQLVCDFAGGADDARTGTADSAHSAISRTVHSLPSAPIDWNDATND